MRFRLQTYGAYGDPSSTLNAVAALADVVAGRRSGADTLEGAGNGSAELVDRLLEAMEDDHSEPQTQVRFV